MALGKKTGGRKKGAINRSTADVRVAVALIAQNMIGDVEEWLRRGAVRDPLGAARTFALLLEYHIPKLQRTEITGKDGKDFQLVQASPVDAML